MNHGSLPSFHDNVNDLAAAIIGDKKAKKANFEEKLAKIHELPIVKIPKALPGDCDVKSFLLENVTPYAGESSSFLSAATERTLKTWARCEELMEIERQRGIIHHYQPWTWLRLVKRRGCDQGTPDRRASKTSL
jgi:hypothetical protein